MINIKVIIVNGHPSAGKTSFERICKTIMGSYCQSRSTVDKVKSIAFRAGWNGEKTPEARKFLSDLKDLLTKFNDMPFRDVITHLELFKSELINYGVHEMPAIFFIDSREPDEIARFKKQLGAITLLIRRPSDKDQEYSNHSDADVDNFEYDYVIQNDGSLVDLEVKAQEFINWLFK